MQTFQSPFARCGLVTFDGFGEWEDSSASLYLESDENGTSYLVGTFPKQFSTSFVCASEAIATSQSTMMISECDERRHMALC